MGVAFPASCARRGAQRGQHRQVVDRHRRRAAVHQGDRQRRPRHQRRRRRRARRDALRRRTRPRRASCSCSRSAPGSGRACSSTACWCRTPSSATSRSTATTPSNGPRPAPANARTCRGRSGPSGSSTTCTRVVKLFSPDLIIVGGGAAGSPTSGCPTSTSTPRSSPPRCTNEAGIVGAALVGVPTAHDVGDAEIADRLSGQNRVEASASSVAVGGGPAQLEVLVAADLVGQGGDRDRLVEVVGVEAARRAARRPARTRGSSPARAGAPRPSGTDRRACRAAACTGRACASTGLVRGPSFILFFMPIARSIGGCRCHVTFVPAPADRLVARRRASGSEQQAGDLVLVLVGHQLVQVAGDGLGERACSPGRRAARPTGPRRRGRRKRRA